MTDILMPKATAVWLVDNTSLAFEQIADFCGLHPLEVKGIADGEGAISAALTPSPTASSPARSSTARPITATERRPRPAATPSRSLRLRKAPRYTLRVAPPTAWTPSPGSSATTRK